MAARIITLFTTIFNLLDMLGLDRVNEVAQLWVKAALSCLAGDDRCFGGGGGGRGGGGGARRNDGGFGGRAQPSGPADDADYEAAKSLSFAVREVGFVLLTRAVSLSVAGANPSSRAGRLGMRLRFVLNHRVRDVLGTLLAAPTADAALLRLASQVRASGQNQHLNGNTY